MLTLRRFLLIFLSLLQLVAPLVHAHSGNNFAQFGLHLPSFEVYSYRHTANTPALQATDPHNHSESGIVSISTGIKNQQHSLDDLPPLLYFPPYPPLISPALSSHQINFSPPQLHSTKTFAHSPQSPRAPPV